MPSERLLTKSELQVLRPQERVKYVHKIILSVLDVKKEMTLSDIIEKTSLGRPTVTKHLGLLAALQQVKKEEKVLGRNKIAFYKKFGERIGNNQPIFQPDESTAYSFFMLEDDEDKSICIQQMEEDEFNTSKIKGTIIIKYEYLEKFMRELYTYAGRVVQK